MKVKNMPGNVTRRRAEAFKRANGTYPEGYEPAEHADRLGRKKRPSVARKFMGSIAALALLALSSVASAEETKPAKPVACHDFAVATTTDGSKVAICAASKAGGKPTLLRVFEVVTVAGQRLAVGYR